VVEEVYRCDYDHDCDLEKRKQRKRMKRKEKQEVRQDVYVSCEEVIRIPSSRNIFFKKRREK